MKKFLATDSNINAESADGTTNPENTHRTIGGNHSSYHVTTTEYLNTSTSRSAKINSSTNKKYAKSILNHQ